MDLYNVTIGNVVGGKSFPPLPGLLDIESGSLGELVLTQVTSTNIQSAASGGRFDKIGSVSGAGVLATGWQFPDAVMANGVPYISESSHAPAIKVNGVVQPYP
jgi:hypothetical protein